MTIHLRLPRESEIRGALNRFTEFLDEQHPLIHEVTQKVSEIEGDHEFGVLLKTSSAANALAPVAAYVDHIAQESPAFAFLLDNAWLWPDLAATKPSFARMRWTAIPRDWGSDCHLLRRLICDGCSTPERYESLESIRLVRNYHLARHKSNGSAGLRFLRALSEPEVRRGEDLGLERAFLYHRLLRILLAVQVGVSSNAAALRILTEEVWSDWESYTAEEQAYLRPVFTRSLRDLIPRYQAQAAKSQVTADWVPAFSSLLSLAIAIGNRPERHAVDQMRKWVLDSVDKIGKPAKPDPWESLRRADLRLGQGKGQHADTVIVISRPLATKNRDAKPFERLTQPLPLHRVRPRQVQQARRYLSAEFPWFAELTQRITDEVEAALWLGESYARFAPILLVGRPGVGKTRYARRLSQLLQTPLAHVVMNGMKSSMQLKGSSAGWSDSRPSVFIEQMLWMESANYFVLLDEIDKCSTSDYHGNPLDVLLSVLERENAKYFADECLGTTVDLSRLSFIATANDIGRLPGPLLSRFRIIDVDAPLGSQLASVVLGARDDRARELGVDPRMLPLLADEVEALAKAGRSPRQVVRLTLDYLMQRELETARAPTVRH